MPTRPMVFARYALTVAVVIDLATWMIAAGGAGCTPRPAVGAPCDLGVPTTAGTVTISSPALECDGRLCVQSGSAAAFCSAECRSDDDCGTVAPANDGGACDRGFTCAAATAVGSYACRRLCICRDALPAPACPSGS